jgi:hypothetical protein
MNVLLSNETIYSPEEIEEQWFLSEVNDHGDLTIYRNHKNMLSPVAVAHFATGEWKQVT